MLTQRTKIDQDTGFRRIRKRNMKEKTYTHCIGNLFHGLDVITGNQFIVCIEEFNA